jgi:hypothetical protein
MIQFFSSRIVPAIHGGCRRLAVRSRHRSNPRRPEPAGMSMRPFRFSRPRSSLALTFGEPNVCAR